MCFLLFVIASKLFPDMASITNKHGKIISRFQNNVHALYLEIRQSFSCCEELGALQREQEEDRESSE